MSNGIVLGLGGHIYPIEIVKCYKSEISFFFSGSPLLNIYQHTIASAEGEPKDLFGLGTRIKESNWGCWGLWRLAAKRNITTLRTEGVKGGNNESCYQGGGPAWAGAIVPEGPRGQHGSSRMHGENTSLLPTLKHLPLAEPIKDPANSEAWAWQSTDVMGWVHQR